MERNTFAAVAFTSYGAFCISCVYEAGASVINGTMGRVVFPVVPLTG